MNTLQKLSNKLTQANTFQNLLYTLIMNEKTSEEHILSADATAKELKEILDREINYAIEDDLTDTVRELTMCLDKAPYYALIMNDIANSYAADV